jgi:hypothetical protein
MSLFNILCKTLLEVSNHWTNAQREQNYGVGGALHGHSTARDILENQDT